MYCTNCGKELKENETCHCRSMENAAGNTKEKKAPKRIILLGGAVLAVLLVVVLLFTNGAEKIELKGYINTQPSIIGLNGKASISMYGLFDYSALETDIYEIALEKNGKDVANMSNADLEILFEAGAAYLLDIDQALDDIVITVYKDGTEVEELTELSNGTKVKIEAKSINPSNTELDIKFQTGKVEFVVEGLSDGTAVDAFEATELKVSFEGTQHDGTAVLEWNKDVFSELNIRFRAEYGEEGCVNGAEVKVVLDYTASDWEAKGYYPVEEYRTYTVEGLGTLVSSLEEIPDEYMEQMKKMTEDTLKKTAQDEWVRGISIEDMTYLGCYLLNEKQDAGGFGSENILYLVYKVDVFENFAPNGGTDSKFSYYHAGCFEEVIVRADGTINLTETKFTNNLGNIYREAQTGSGLISFGYLFYDGYKSTYDLFEELVRSRVDYYTYVTTMENVK